MRAAAPLDPAEVRLLALGLGLLQMAGVGVPAAPGFP